VFYKNLIWKKVRQIGVQSNRLCWLQRDSPMALISSGNNIGKEFNELRHRRMGHLHHGTLKMLKEIVIGVLELGTKHDDVCKGCVLGKYVKATFPRSYNREDGVLGHIHSDIYGPMSTRTLNGAEYFITFIDDHSSKTWIYFFKDQR